MSRFPTTPHDPPVPASSSGLHGHEPYTRDEPAHGRGMKRKGKDTLPQKGEEKSGSDNSADPNPGTDAGVVPAFRKGDIVVSTRSWTRLTIARIETDPATGITMLTDAEGRSIRANEAHHTGATLAGNSNPLLVLVHPGSGCGSANFNIGQTEALQIRRILEDMLSHWEGGLLIVDGALSEELTYYPLGRSIDQALDTAQTHGALAERIYACDSETENWTAQAASALDGFPSDQTIVLAGAWYTPEPSLNDDDPNVSRGCVNALYARLAKMGFTRIAIEEKACFHTP